MSQTFKEGAEKCAFFIAKYDILNIIVKRYSMAYLFEEARNMATKIGINGFGRIGRMVFRKAIQDPELEVVAINATYPAETLAHLIKYDSVQGFFPVNIEIEENALIVDGKRVRLLAS